MNKPQTFTADNIDGITFKCSDIIPNSTEDFTYTIKVLNDTNISVSWEEKGDQISISYKMDLVLYYFNTNTWIKQ